MGQQKIILFYEFTPFPDPVALRMWQQTLAESLNLRGRVLISPHGINGTLGGSIKSLAKYIKMTKKYPGLGNVDFKWSQGCRDDFPKLSVRNRDEIVSFGAPEELVVDRSGVVGGGVHLTPEEVHALVAKRGDNVVFFDGRNGFEAEIGRFKDAVISDVQTTHDFIREIDSGKYDHLKDLPVVTYCTGGVRCEVLSSVMVSRGFNEVYQISGGVVRYGEVFGNRWLWEGSLYVFDRRMVVDFEKNPKQIGKCEMCQGATKFYMDCSNPQCRKLIVMCPDCQTRHTPMDCGHVAVDSPPLRAR